MFRWFTSRGGGLREVEDLFTAMLADDRHVFDLATSARVGGADPETVREDLLRTEERTDEAERSIRRLVLVHASVHGAAAFPACLLYMSVAKDAERIGDLSKNLFAIAETVGPPPPGELRDHLVRLRDRISPMIVQAARIFADEDADAAHRFIAEARDLQDGCRARIDALLREESVVPQPVATGLTYRHMARVVANLLNIVSAVVVPLDRLDYPTREDERG